MKKIIIFLLLISTLTLMAQPIFAAQPIENEQQHENATDATVALTITPSGFATVSIYVKGKSTLKRVSATTYIDKKVGTGWTRVNIGTSGNTWQDLSSSKIVSKTHTVTLSGSGEYRVTTIFTLTGSKTTEKITKTSVKTY